MFSVIYEFHVIADKEHEFKSLWHQLTMEIKKFRGGLGSRLHKVVDGDYQWIAYAQWPSKNCWLDQSKNNQSMIQLSSLLKETCNSMQTIYELEVVDDLLF